MRKIYTISVALGASLVVSLAAPAALAAQGESHGAAWDLLFSVDVGLMIWTLLVFGVLLWVLSKFAWKPLLGALEAREGRIQGSIDEADKQNAEAQKLLEEHRQQLADARRQAQQIISESKEAGEQVRREIEEKARTEGQALLERARQDIERERDAALDTLRRESVELAMAAAGKLIGQKVDAESDRKLVTDYLQSVSSQDHSKGHEA